MNSKKIMCQKIFSEYTLHIATTEDAYMEILEEWCIFKLLFGIWAAALQEIRVKKVRLQCSSVIPGDLYSANWYGKY